MVAQRMGDQRGGVGSNSIGEIQAKVRNRMLDPLDRQGSLYSLTLDEVQNHLCELGKPLGSLNLDELVRIVWMAEVSGDERGCADGELDAGHLSSIVSVDLSKKTVDEVWQEIQVGHGTSSVDGRSVTTLGEMTLEDFLVKAGVVAESGCGMKSLGSADSGIGVSQWMDYQVPSLDSQQPLQGVRPDQLPSMDSQQGVMPVLMQGHPVQVAVSLVRNPIMDATFPNTQRTASPSPPGGTLLDTQTPRQKRHVPVDIAEKSVERRQKRMIKNRESAARSRARKQAYTQELENKISRLEEEIKRLKKQKEFDKALYAIPLPEPKHEPRRTVSAPL